jgi:pimeloyl-ACP methyl ester carboxylesterase
MVEVERGQVQLVDGRHLDVQHAGPRDAPAVVFQTGTPSAGLLFEPHVVAGIERGLRHIAYSRPGYGHSQRHPGRSVAACAADVAAVADALGAERFYTVGWSGGGPHALACAALLGDRVRAAATIASVAPWGAEGLDWLDGMGEENHEEFGAVLGGEAPLRAWMKANAPGFARITPEQAHVSMGDLVSDVDRDALTGEFARYFAALVGDALIQGFWGWFDDDLAVVEDWGFELAAITTPVTIWQGGQDRFVPPAHGGWLADHVTGAQSELRPDQGHLSLVVNEYGSILDGLLAAGA